MGAWCWADLCDGLADTIAYVHPFVFIFYAPDIVHLDSRRICIQLDHVRVPPLTLAQHLNRAPLRIARASLTQQRPYPQLISVR